MIEHDSLYETLLYLLVYALIGWAVQVCLTAVRDRRFVNGGLLNLPLNIPCGLTAVILLMLLPTLNRLYVLQYAITVVVVIVVRSVTDQFVRQVTRTQGRQKAQPGARMDWRDAAKTLILAGAYLLVYLVVHPVLFGLLTLLPGLLVRIVVFAGAALIVADFFGVVYTLRTNTASKTGRELRENTQRMANRLTGMVWNRLQKAYPGVLETEDPASRYVFARGFCFDKLAWVFLASSFLGALIEMAFCRVTGGVWMSRSSVIYGPFSVVWGFGAVVLTISLQRVADKADRHVFAAGFVVGGAYEYFCSVFTEIVFGTVFWDYSEMPLNIGGRTNVLYCIFWGLLAVIWIKIIYPRMASVIEKLPPIFGKVLTWALVIVMACNGILTAGAMIRYRQRQAGVTNGGVIGQFLDERYDDAWMERRWPNMVLTDAQE